MERRRPLWPCAGASWQPGQPARGAAVWCLIAAVLLASLAQPALGQTGIGTSDQKTCRATCSRGCKRFTTSTGDRQFSCPACKRGFTKTSGYEYCNGCAPGYATRIDPSLPLSVRRGFTQCTQEPCTRCSVCPQGTYSSGGPALLAANTSAATCYGNGGGSFQQSIIAQAQASPLSCPDGQKVASLMAASLKSQPGVQASTVVVTYNGPTNPTPQGATGGYCDYQFSVSYSGPASIGNNIVAASSTPVTDTSTGVCAVYPNAAGSNNLCVALLSKTAGAGVGVLGTSQTSSNLLPNSIYKQEWSIAQIQPTCQDATGTQLALVTQASLVGRSEFANAVATYTPPCSIQPAPAGSYIDEQGYVHVVGYVALGGPLKNVGSGRRLLVAVAEAEAAAAGYDAALQSGSSAPERALEGALEAPGRSLLQSQVNKALYVAVYPIIYKVLAAASIPQSTVDTTTIQIIQDASNPNTVTVAYPSAPGQPSIPQLIIDTTNSAVIVAGAVNITAPPTNTTTTEWAAYQQTFVTTSIDTGCNVLIPKFIADGVTKSLAGRGLDQSLITVQYPTVGAGFCEANQLGKSYALSIAYQGSQSYGNAILTASLIPTPYAVCAAYVKALPGGVMTGNFFDVCKYFYDSTTADQTIATQQILCTTAGQPNSCPAPCATGTFRNGLSSTDCPYALGGYYSSTNVVGDPMSQCPADTAVPTYPARLIGASPEQATASSCLPCPAGTTTNSATGQYTCQYLATGYVVSGGKPSICPADTYQPSVVLLTANNVPTTCTACPTGQTTNGKPGQAACVPVSASTVPAGSKFVSGAITPCADGEFMPFSRQSTDAGAGFCFKCSNVYSYRGVSGARTYVSGVASGAGSGATSCTCPQDTFWAADPGASAANPAFACVTCPTGSTSGASGATNIAQCQAACRVGFWGYPSNPAYGFACQLCPSVSPGNINSATTGTTPLTVDRVPRTACTTCANGGQPTGGSAAPQPCAACATGFTGPSCSSCAMGYTGGGCSQTCTASGTSSCGCPAGTGSGCSACPTDPNASGSNRGFVLPAVPTTDNSNCVAGCLPGTGVSFLGDQNCAPCSGGYSPGATPGNPFPVCLKCPTANGVSSTPESSPPPLYNVPSFTFVSNTRCVTIRGAAAPDGLFDEFD